MEPGKPSERAAAMMRLAMKHGGAELRRHLAAGRAVYGRRNGEPGYVARSWLGMTVWLTEERVRDLEKELKDLTGV